MPEFALDYGQKFFVDGTEFEVVSIASNEHNGETVFEILTVADADLRRERNKPEPVVLESDEDGEAEVIPAEPETLALK